MNQASVEGQIPKGFASSLELPVQTRTLLSPGQFANRVADLGNFRVVVGSWIFDRRVALGGIIGGLVLPAVSYPSVILGEALTSVQSTPNQTEALNVLVLFGSVTTALLGAMTQLRREGDIVATQGHFNVRSGEFVDLGEHLPAHVKPRIGLEKKHAVQSADLGIKGNVFNTLTHPITAGLDNIPHLNSPISPGFAYNTFFSAENGQFVLGKNQFVAAGISPKTGLEISPRERVLKGLQLIRHLARYHFSNNRFPD